MNLLMKGIVDSYLPRTVKKPFNAAEILSMSVSNVPMKALNPVKKALMVSSKTPRSTASDEPIEPSTSSPVDSDMTVVATKIDKQTKEIIMRLDIVIANYD